MIFSRRKRIAKDGQIEKLKRDVARHNCIEGGGHYWRFKTVSVVYSWDCVDDGIRIYFECSNCHATDSKPATIKELRALKLLKFKTEYANYDIIIKRAMQRRKRTS